MKLSVANANITNALSTASISLANTNIVNSISLGNVSVTPSQISIGSATITPTAVSVPALILGGSSFSGGLQSGIINYQQFTANGTWYNPYANASVNASLTGYEQVLVMAWGGGGGGASNNSISRAGGGGGCSIGQYTLSFLSNTVTVNVGSGGAASRTTTTAFVAAPDGGNTSFGSFFAYGGEGGDAGGAGGGGALGVGIAGVGGSPLGGASGTPGGTSTFGGGGGGGSSGSAGGQSIFGGGGGGERGSGGASIYGGGGGSANATAGVTGNSIFGGIGGGSVSGANVSGQSPAGGGGANTSTAGAGARGEVRVWVFGPSIGPSLLFKSSSEVSNTTEGFSSYTFAATPIGSAVSSRKVYALIGTRSGGTGNVSSITIGGVAATIHRQDVATNSGVHGTCIASALVPTGNTADIVVNYDATLTSLTRVAVSVASFIYTNPVSSNGATSTSGSTLSADITPVPGAYTIAVAGDRQAHTVTWTGVTEDIDSVIGTDTNYSVASGTETASTTKTVTAQFSGSATRLAMSVISVY